VKSGWEPRWTIRTTPLQVHGPHPEVVEGDIVLGGVAVGQRLEDGGVAAFGLQQLAQLPQHRGTVGGNPRVSSHVTLGDAGKLRE